MGRSLFLWLRGQTTVPDIKQWEALLATAIPKDVADIKIEAVFDSKSNSSLCLVTMPIAVFDMLKHEDAYRFIAYIESHNLMNTTSPFVLPARHGKEYVRLQQ